MRKALVFLKVPTFPVLRLHLHPTSPRAGSFALLPKPHKLLRSPRGSRNCQVTQSETGKRRIMSVFFKGLRKKRGLPDNENIWEKGRRLRLSWNRKNRRFLLSQAFTRRPLETLASQQENPQPSWNTTWICPAGKSWILFWPIFLINQIAACSNSHN